MDPFLFWLVLRVGAGLKGSLINSSVMEIFVIRSGAVIDSS